MFEEIASTQRVDELKNPKDVYCARDVWALGDRGAVDHFMVTLRWHISYIRNPWVIRLRIFPTYMKTISVSVERPAPFPVFSLHLSGFGLPVAVLQWMRHEYEVTRSSSVHYLLSLLLITASSLGTAVNVHSDCRALLLDYANVRCSYCTLECVCVCI